MACGPALAAVGAPGRKCRNRVGQQDRGQRGQEKPRRGRASEPRTCQPIGLERIEWSAGPRSPSGIDVLPSV